MKSTKPVRPRECAHRAPRASSAAGPPSSRRRRRRCRRRAGSCVRRKWPAGEIRRRASRRAGATGLASVSGRNCSSSETDASQTKPLSRGVKETVFLLAARRVSAVWLVNVGVACSMRRTDRLGPSRSALARHESRWLKGIAF